MAWLQRSRTRVLVLASVALVVALAIFVAVWFQPQKLWIDDRVSEAIPTGDQETPRPATPVTLSAGELRSRDHTTTGAVRVLELAGGERVLRFEDLDTSNGPDLRVYLTATPAGGEESTFDDDYVELGRLKGNQGDQNYDIPAGVDLARLTGVVIWCDRFDSAFGAADLRPA
jgi:hypothetical protein